MSDLSDDDRLRRAVRAAIRPTAATGPAHDLWPRVVRRLAQQPPRASLLDWALLAAAGVWLVVFPESVVVLLYHL
jgi:hypothetical protein